MTTNTPVLKKFPNSPSIPPATFYDTKGLAGWLNAHPAYKRNFVGFTEISEYLLVTTSTTSSFGYNPETVPLAPFITNLSCQQALQYDNQLNLFKKVYAYNSNAYMNYYNNGIAPIYYRFQTYQEYTQYKASVQLINKIYPFNAMANAYNVSSYTDFYVQWVVPFPL